MIARTALACALLLAGGASATDMDHKGKVIATAMTQHAGLAEVTCNDPQGWKFSVRAEEDDGRDVVTVRIESPADATPPRFGVFFRVSGAGVQNVWTSDCGKDGFHVWPQLWWDWNAKYASQLARESPIAVGFNSQEIAPVALACSEAFNDLEFGLYADDRTCEMVGRCEFFTKPVAATKTYEVSVMLDRRGRGFAETVRSCSAWVAGKNGFKTAFAPEAAFDPLYSTWYAYLQDVHDKELEEEARLAAGLGMKTMILDDGWQKVDSKTFYSATGDWMPVPSRFPDMKAHVAAVHEAGLKYMLWLAVPFMGNEAKNYPRFKRMLLKDGDTGVLDPRFPEVREYLISTYERVVGEWGFDGVKLDFIDSFRLPAKDPALADNYAGRDYRSLPEAVNRLMKDVLARLRKINPDVLVEFRQHYMGPAILQYGNMMRCADCPADPCANRRRICDLRLTSEGIAVHSDMLVWSGDETQEGAALPILNALFSTVQYSMILARAKPAHREVIRRWIAFSQAHREALLKGEFRPHHPENGYTWIEGESAAERIIAAYSPDVCVRTGSADKPVFLVNATGTAGMLVDFASPAAVEFFDTLGRSAGTASADHGPCRLDVPASGYARVTWKEVQAADTDTNAAVVATLETSLGEIVLSLDPSRAPVTVSNFVAYVNAGHYDGTVFHRVIDGFMIQGGGFSADMVQKETRAPIANEAANGLKNERGTIAMARTMVVDSATSQFFINLKDNGFLNHMSDDPRGFGYAVFGRVTKGMDIVDRIAKVRTGNHGFHQNVPVEPVVIRKATVSAAR